MTRAAPAPAAPPSPLGALPALDPAELEWRGRRAAHEAWRREATRNVAHDPGAYAGDPEVTDATIDAGNVDVDWSDRPEGKGGVTGVAGLILAGLTVGYFGLRILGVFG